MQNRWRRREVDRGNTTLGPDFYFEIYVPYC